MARSWGGVYGLYLDHTKDLILDTSPPVLHVKGATGDTTIYMFPSKLLGLLSTHPLGIVVGRYNGVFM